MSSLPPSTFADLLRHYRQAVGLTQEELAERARLSVQAIGALERGDRRAPRKETISLLAEALSLTSPERAAFEAAARQREQTDPTSPGETMRGEETPLPPLGEDGRAPQNVPQQHGAWNSLQLDVARSFIRNLNLRGIVSRRRVSVPLAGVLLFALLGSTLIINGVGIGNSSLLCGGNIALATDAPTTGVDAIVGKPVEDAINLAVLQHHDLGGGYNLKAINYDDESTAGDGDDPARGASNMKSMVKNACIVGMIGPYGSHEAQTEMPIAANAGLAMISPSNTNPGLTLRQYATAGLPQGITFDQLHPTGKMTNYFRVVANDAIQMLADADFTADELAARSVYIVVSRPSPYGGLLVGGFATEFLAKGGTVVATENLEWHDPAAPAALAARIAAAAPDAVYFGGTQDGGAGLLKEQLALHGYTGPFVSGDGVAGDSRFIDQAGGASAAQNSYATVAGPDLSTFTAGAAAKFLHDYRARYPGQQATIYAATAYDAAMIEITAIKNLIRMGRAVTRAAVIEQIQNIQYTGITGPIRFDKNGDDVYGAFTVYSVLGTTWVPYASVTV
jgi:branched-chain amino acid transport system substrate-binding protein